MSTIKSSDEHLTLNADGSSKDIKFQANGVEVGSLSSSGVMTATSFAGSGANLTGLSSFNPDGAVVFNESGADVDFRVESDTKVNAFTVNGATGRVGVNRGTDPDARLEVSAASETALAVTATVSGEYGVIVTSGSTNATPIMDLRDTNNASRLKVLADGRGLSKFTAFAWCNIGLDNVAAGNSNPGGALNISTVTLQSTGVARFNYTNSSSSNNVAAVTVGNTAGGTANWNGSTSSYIEFSYYHSNGNVINASGVNMVSFGGN